MALPTRTAAFCDIKSEFAKTKTLLERIPEDKFDWQPHEKSWPMIKMATHLANLPTWVGFSLNTDGLDVSAPFPSVPIPKTTRELVERFDKNCEEALRAIENVTDEQLDESWSLKHGDHIISTRPKYEVIREWSINHIIHHRAQLTMYFRLTNIAVPPLFGPSADES